MKDELILLIHRSSFSNVVYHLHGDHLGSTSLTTDQSGNKFSEVRYLPYGQEREIDDTPSPTDFGFTGQRSEAGFGLMDYNARYYSPYLGRFVSPDTIVPNPASSQSFNRYAYVHNNPCNFLDPSGHQACGSSEWEQSYRDSHRGEAPYSGAVADCETTNSIGGANTWTNSDWDNFYYAKQEGLTNWMSEGVSFTGSWKGDQLLAAVLGLNMVKNVLGSNMNKVLLGGGSLELIGVQGDSPGGIFNGQKITLITGPGTSTPGPK